MKMNRIYSCIIAFIALTLVSCMDERDEYGFYIEYRGIDRAKQFDANTNTLTIDLTGYWNENSELNGAECGFIVDGKEIPGNITGDHMTAQISQITLDEPHTVAMYCRNEGNELVSQTQTWQWSKEEFAPNPVEDLTLYINKKGEYQYSQLIYQRDSKLPLTAQVTIGARMAGRRIPECHGKGEQHLRTEHTHNQNIPQYHQQYRAIWR